jgi:hypothetical protein
MKVQCTDKKTCELLDEGKRLGRIIYEGFFSFKAELFVDQERYVVTPKGFFNTTMSVDFRGREIATMTMSWKGYVVFSLQDGREYRLKPTGPFYNKFVLEDRDERKLLSLDPDFQWSKFNYNFNVLYEEAPEDLLLVLMAVYAAIFFMSGNSGEGY